MRAAWKRAVVLTGVAVGASAATFVAVRARAAGIPETGALTYTGYLENPDGTPVTGPKSIGVALYDAESDGNIVCEQRAVDVEPVSGRFQLDLPDKCATAVKANPALWVEVQVEGASLGRTKLGAVPYAIGAAHAVSATDADEAAHALVADTATDSVKLTGDETIAGTKTFNGLIGGKAGGKGATLRTRGGGNGVSMNWTNNVLTPYVEDTPVSVASADVAKALANAAFRFSTSCSSNGSSMDCTCTAGEIAISGGGWGSSKPLLESAAALNSAGVRDLQKWRVSCLSSGAAVPCDNQYALCMKVAP